jgi:hypothetical protein
MSQNFKNSVKSSLYKPTSYETLSQYSLAGGGSPNFSLPDNFQKKLIAGSSKINGINLNAYQNQMQNQKMYTSCPNCPRNNINRNNNNLNHNKRNNNDLNNNNYNINNSLKSNIRNCSF